MNNVRGGESGKYPGEFKRSQNWIGGSTPHNALFVPPPPSETIKLMGNIEEYFYEDDLPPLVKCALIHYQFETIHPFCDGNGRMGRILIILYLIWKGILSSPVLYLSLYFKENRQSYYDYLMLPSQTGNFEKWIEFFLTGVVSTAKKVNETTRKILQLEKDNKIKILAIKATKAIHLLDLLAKKPIIDNTYITNYLNISYPSASLLIKDFLTIGILEQISKGNRNKKYIYREYMNILQEGTENL